MSLAEKMKQCVGLFRGHTPGWEMFSEANRDGCRRAAYRCVGAKEYRGKTYAKRARWLSGRSI